jgi:hypothetical protein
MFTAGAVYHDEVGLKGAAARKGCRDDAEDRLFFAAGMLTELADEHIAFLRQGDAGGRIALLPLKFVTTRVLPTHQA